MILSATNLADSLFSMGIPIGEKVLRTVAVYVGLVMILRLAGKRDLAQLNSFDLVVLLLLSNVVQNAVIGPDNSLWGGIIGAGVLVAVNAVIVRVSVRNRAFTRMLEGVDTELVHDGVVDEARLRSLSLRRTDLLVAVRRQGASTLDEVQTATISPDGTITVDLKPQEENATKGDVARLEAKLDALLAASR